MYIEKDKDKLKKLSEGGVYGSGLAGDKEPTKTVTTSSTETSNNGLTLPAYETKGYDDSAKGKYTWDVYQGAKGSAFNRNDFTYDYQGQLDKVMNAILNRGRFSYNFNEDAFYQMYKDKYIQQGKMAMADTMGQAAAMTGGYGNSYAATVGNQAYQSSLQNLNDIIPELYQMAYDHYNNETAILNNQYSMLADDYAREYGKYADEYGRLMDAVNVTAKDYYSGADIYNTDRSDANSVASQSFKDAMNLANFNREAEWRDEDKLAAAAAAQTEWNKWLVENNASEDEEGNIVKNPEPVINEVLASRMQNYDSVEDWSAYLEELEKSGAITEDEAVAYIDKYMQEAENIRLQDRSWRVGVTGKNENNTTIRDQFGNEYTLKKLRKDLEKTMSKEDASTIIDGIKERLGIKFDE